MDQVRAEKPAYFIKLGRKGAWEKSCIENNMIMLGFNNPLHSECMNGEWGKVYDYWISRGKRKNEATKGGGQVIWYAQRVYLVKLLLYFVNNNSTD